MHTRPMLAATLCIKEDGLIYYKDDKTRSWEIYTKPLPFPLLVTPKIDGIRCVIRNGKAVTRELKPIPNIHIREWLEKYAQEGWDGEIDIEGIPFNEKSSQIMSHYGEPQFIYRVFDLHNMLHLTSAEHRGREVANLKDEINSPFLDFLVPELISNLDDLQQYEEWAFEKGYEGVMLRLPSSPYKEGRSTLKQFWLVKFIRIAEDEAVVTGFTEQMENTNEKTENALGLSTRSSHQANKIPKGTLGALWVKSLHFEKEFKVDGFTKEYAQHVWNNQDYFLGKVLTFKYKPFGVKDCPRHPKFKAWRHDIE